MQNKSEIRKDYFLDKYVIITPSRAKRPRDVKEQTVLKRVQSCPFCPENINLNNIVDKIGSQKKWKVLAVKNIFPAVSQDNNKAYGTQEVIIKTPNHNHELADLSEKHIKNILKFLSFFMLILLPKNS